MLVGIRCYRRLFQFLRNQELRVRKDPSSPRFHSVPSDMVAIVPMSAPMPTTRLTTHPCSRYVIANWITMIGTVRRKPSGENEGPCNLGGAPKPPPQSPMSHRKRISKQPQIVHFRGKVEPTPHDLLSIARYHFIITQYKFLRALKHHEPISI